MKKSDKEVANKKLVMFDFDGVLVDTLLPCYEISKEVNEGLELGMYKDRFEGNIHDTLKEHGGNFSLHPDFHSKYAEKTRELKIPLEIIDVLRYLHENYTLVIVSSTPTPHIRDILERENALKYFNEILGADVHTHKDVKIRSLLEKYAILPKDTVFITDTVGDIKEARKCGVVSIAVTWGFHEHERLVRAEPAVTVDDPKKISDAIDSVLA